MRSELTLREAELLENLASGLSERETCLRLGMTGSEFSSAWLEILVKAQSRTPTTIADYEFLSQVDRVERHRLEAELWASEARLRGLMDTTPECVFVIDGMSGRIIRHNRQACVMFGYLTEELIGKEMEILLPDDVREKHVNLRRGFLTNVRKREIGYHPPILARRKDGLMIPLDIGLTATMATDHVMVVCRSAILAQVQTSGAVPSG